MKVFVVISAIVLATVAEPPPSNSYLPPPPGQNFQQGPPGQNFQQGPSGFGAAPQVIAARTLDQGKPAARGNGLRGTHSQGSLAKDFGRAAGYSGARAKFGDNSEPGYDRNASPFDRNALEEASEPANYNFGYMVNDYQEGTDFGHHEERQEERAQGEYHVVLPDGRRQTVSYEADEGGFKPHISYEDTESGAATRNGGYDSNYNNVRNFDQQSDEEHAKYGYDAQHENKYQNGGGRRSNGFANGGYNAARSSGY